MALLLGICSTTSAEAADLFIHSRSAADLDELLTPAFEAVPRRRVVQSLDVTLANLLRTPERELLRLEFSGDIATDFGREVLPSSDDPRLAEPVDLTLRRFELVARPVEALHARLGRLVLFGPLTPADLDGAWVEGRAPFGLSAGLGGGREVRRDLEKLDGGAWDPAGARFDLFEAPLATTSLVQAELGYSRGLWRSRAGHRTRWRHGDRVGQHSALSLGLATALLTASVLADWNHLVVAPDRLEASLRVPFVADRASVWLGWRYERPTFDGDSLFNVFAVTPGVGWRVGAEWRLEDRLGLSLEGRLRAVGEGDEPVWSGGLGADGARSGGGELRGHWIPWTPLRLRASASADAGRGGALVSEELAAQLALLADRADVGVRLRHAWRESDQHEPQFGHLLAMRGLGRYNLGSFGRVTASFDLLSDYRFGRSIRVIVAAEFDLGPI